jgi:hypothetical protein
MDYKTTAAHVLKFDIPTLIESIENFSPHVEIRSLQNQWAQLNKEYNRCLVVLQCWVSSVCPVGPDGDGAMSQLAAHLLKVTNVCYLLHPVPLLDLAYRIEKHCALDICYDGLISLLVASLQNLVPQLILVKREYEAAMPRFGAKTNLSMHS